MKLTDSSVLIGAAGEHYVLAELIKRGVIAAKAPEGSPNMDIVTTDLEGNRLVALQVKTRRDRGNDKGWHMKAKHETISSEKLFYVFVDVGAEPLDTVQFYIVPSEVVAYVIRTSHAIWLHSPGRNGRTHNDSDMRRLKPAYGPYETKDDESRGFLAKYGNASNWLETYRNAWHLII